MESDEVVQVSLTQHQLGIIFEVMARGNEDFHYMASFRDNGVLEKDVHEWENNFDEAITALKGGA
jgi:hypothetical protein